MLLISSDFAKLIYNLINSQGGFKVPHSIAHSFLFPLNKQSFELAAEAHRHFIRSLNRISKKSSTQDFLALYSDIFTTV